MTIRLSILTPLVFGLTAVWMSGLSQAAPQRGGGKVTPTLTVTVSPGTIAEGQTATGTVSRVNAANLDNILRVTLHSSDITEAKFDVPDTDTGDKFVDISAGDSSATFKVIGVNDLIGDGAMTITITASATNFKSGSTNVTAATPALPPVRYKIQFIEQLNFDPRRSMHLGGTNKFGQAVGLEYVAAGFTDSVGIIYDPMINLTKVFDLNDIVDPDPTRPNWRINHAISINSSGQIAASIKEPVTGARQAVMIDMNGLSPQLHIIPDIVDLDGNPVLDGYSGGESSARDINEFGDIVALFLRNDGTHGVYVYNFGFLGEGLETPTPIDLGYTTNGWHGINNPTPEHGAQVVGNIWEWNEQLGKSAYTPFRITLGNENRETFPPVVNPSTGNTTTYTALDINDAGFSGDGYIYYKKKIQGYSGEGFGWLKTSSLTTFGAGRGPYRLNGANDFVTYDGELFHGNWGFLSPVALLDTTDADFDTWQGARSYKLLGISDRVVGTDFPQLFGIAEFYDPSSNSYSNYKGFVLTPIPVP